MKRFLQLAIIALAFAACGEKVHIKDLVRKPMDENKVEIFYKDQPFTGTAWADDDKSAAIDVKNGQVVKLIIFYPNGKKACVTTQQGVYYFNKEGQGISPAEFMQEFPDYEEKCATVFIMQEAKQ